MQKRHQHLNIPIEIVRTVVAISETGSLSKAADRLGLSQPAVSSQIKRLQGLVGGALFEKTANGTTPTELGKVALQQARRILEANDQLLRLGGSDASPHPLRLGLSTLFVQEFINRQSANSLNGLVIHADHSVAIGKSLIEEHIDIACIFENPALGTEINDLVINERSDALIWIRSKGFVLSPGAAIPILTWPGDDLMIRTLTRHDLSYKIVFNSPDYHAKLAAVEAGFGLAAIPQSMIPPHLIAAEEYYLPKLPPIRALLCARPERERTQSAALIRQLSELFFERP